MNIVVNIESNHLYMSFIKIEHLEDNDSINIQHVSKYEIVR